jgi:hypothetical protein
MDGLFDRGFDEILAVAWLKGKRKLPADKRRVLEKNSVIERLARLCFQAGFVDGAGWHLNLVEKAGIKIMNIGQIFREAIESRKLDKIRNMLSVMLILGLTHRQGFEIAQKILPRLTMAEWDAVLYEADRGGL